MLEVCSNYKTKIVMLDKTKQKPNILFKKKNTSKTYGYRKGESIKKIKMPTLTKRKLQ